MEEKKISNEEVLNLNKTIKAILKKIEEVEIKIANTVENYEKQKKYYGDNYYGLNKSGELSKLYSDISYLEESRDTLELKRKTLLTQSNSPYFARIDFSPNNSQKKEKMYIGISNVYNGDNVLVIDWRAPIASMYYDYSLGEASFKANNKVYKGELTLKRQYKIENRQILSYFDTDLTISDDILQEVLSKNSSTKMKQIVSSIQKEQNAIVRTEKFDNILVQGVAGSGKTSIALHRAAYLLYKHRNTLKSNDIIILSPNNIFSSYISEVLPQLGENNLAETTYDRICHVELHKPIQARESMLDEVATTPKQEELDEISYKSSFEYLYELVKFLNGPLLETFSPRTLSYCIGMTPNEEKIEITFPEEQTRDLFFNVYKGKDLYERINKIAWQYAMVFTERRHYNKEQFKGLRDRFKTILYNFLPIKDVDKLLEIFFIRNGLSLNKDKHVRYMDKGTMLAIKHFLYGFNHDFSAKYLIIDEMQDFTPVDLYIFRKLWTCPSIVLGDINQCIEKCLNDEYLKQISAFLETELVELKKTYRSTKQIAEFAHNMIDLKNIEYVNRNGDKPKLIKTEDYAKTIAEYIKSECQNYEHVAIICKCNKEMHELSKLLKGKLEFTEIKEPEDYNNKVLLTTCATAKGIEFDCVILPFANAENYKNSLEKNILYVSSTRALHKLAFLYNDKPSKFLKELEK